MLTAETIRMRWVWAIGAVGVAAVVYLRLGEATPPSMPAAPAPSTLQATDSPAPAGVPAVECAADLACAARSALPVAAPACSQAIEQLAAFGARWTGAVDPAARFPRQRWLDAAAHTLTLGGDGVEFRNGADAYAIVDYVCDVDPVRGRVTDVRARPRPSRE